MLYLAETPPFAHSSGKYPEIEEEYNLLQEQLELAARTNAVKPPTNVLVSI